MSKLFSCCRSSRLVENKCLFCGLDPLAVEILEKGKIYNTYKKNQNIYLQGNYPFGLYWVQGGNIKISVIGKDGKEAILRLAKSGDILDSCNLFNNEPYRATATSLEESVVCFLDKEYFFKAIEKYPQITLNIISQISRSMGCTEDNNVALVQKSVPERLAALLLSLQVTYGIKDGNRSRLDIKLTREEMASMIGTTSVTLVRIITEFKSEGVLELEGKNILIVNEEKLIKIANL